MTSYANLKKKSLELIPGPIRKSSIEIEVESLHFNNILIASEGEF